jgi:hypothetical protein
MSYWPADPLSGGVAGAKVASWCAFRNNDPLSTRENTDLIMKQILR